MPLPETPRHTWASQAQSLVGSLLLSPWSWCSQGFVCALQESVSPVLWKFCYQVFQNQAPWDTQYICHIPRLGSLLGLELSQQWENFFWHNCSPVCESPGRQLYSGANSDLLQKDLCHTLCLPGLLLPEPLSPQQASANSCLC